MVQLADINKQRSDANVTETNTVYNSRTADANATVQQGDRYDTQLSGIQQQRSDLLAAHQAGTISQEEYDRQNTYLTNSAYRVGTAAQYLQNTQGADAQQHMNEATSTYNNQAAGFGTSLNTQTGQTSLAGNGALQQSAIDRIKAEHPEWSDAQVAQQVNSQQPGIQSTMSQSGQGMKYGKNGVAIPGSEGDGFRTNNLGRNAAAVKAKSDANIAGIKGYRSVPIFDEKGNITGYRQEEDPAETARLQAEARTAAQNKAAADANYAAGLNNNESKNTNAGNAGAASTTEQNNSLATDTPPPPNPDSFLNGLDALEQQYAGTAMAPLFEFYKGQYADLQAKGLRGEQLMGAIQKKTDAYVKQQQNDMSAMGKAWTAMYDNIQKSQLESAQRTYDQQQRLAQQQKQKDAMEYDRAIRDQNIRNEEDRQRLLMGNGISGGWRSSMHTAKMIDAFKKADNIVADLQNDKIQNSDAWDNKMIDIEQNYHTNVTAAYDSHNVNLLTLQDKLQARAAEIDKTIYNNDVNQMTAVNKLTEDWYTGVSAIAKGTTEAVIQIQRDAQTAAAKAKDDVRADQAQIIQQEQNHISHFGDTDPQGWAAIQARKQALGLPTFDNLPSLQQQDKMQKQVLASMSQALITDPKSTVAGTNYGLLGANAFSSTKYSADEVQRGLQNINTLIQGGKISDAKHQILNYTRQGMGQAQQEQITSQDNLINEIGFMKSEMSQYSPTFGPLWTNLIQSGKPILGMSKNPQYVDFVAHVQRVLGEERHRLFGAALTSNENMQADSYLFNPAQDTAATLLNKINNLEEIARRSRATRYDEVLGQGAYSSLTGETVKTGAPGNMSPANGATPVDTQQEQFNSLMDFWNNPSGAPPSSLTQPQSGGVSSSDTGTPSYSDSSPLSSYVKNNGFRVTQYYNGTYDQNNAKAINGGTTVFSDGRTNHASYNIAPPKPGMRNVPAPVFKGGDVIAVKNSSKGYGNEVRIKDADGNTWIYGHLDKISVKKGDKLMAGIPVGTMGRSGWATGVTLHLEARDKDNKPFDFAIS